MRGGAVREEEECGGAKGRQCAGAEWRVHAAHVVILHTVHARACRGCCVCVCVCVMHAVMCAAFDAFLRGLVSLRHFRHRPTSPSGISFFRHHLSPPSDITVRHFLLSPPPFATTCHRPGHCPIWSPWIPRFFSRSLGISRILCGTECSHSNVFRARIFSVPAFSLCHASCRIGGML